MPFRATLITIPLVIAAVLLSGPAVASAAPCPSTTTDSVFSRFGDDADYTLVPGGGFEGDMPDWTLSGAAQVVSHNDSYYLRAKSDTRGLLLFPGSSAVSPAFCVGVEHPTLRFMARGGGGQLRVDALYSDGDGTPQTVQLGIVRSPGNSSWQATPILPLATMFPDLGADGISVQIRVTSEGPTSYWAIDDVFYDPWRR